MVVYLIATGKVPFSTLPGEVVAELVLTMRLQPAASLLKNQSLAAIMSRAWSRDAADRPDASAIVEELARLDALRKKDKFFSRVKTTMRSVVFSKSTGALSLSRLRLVVSRALVCLALLLPLALPLPPALQLSQRLAAVKVVLGRPPPPNHRHCPPACSLLVPHLLAPARGASVARLRPISGRTRP